MWRPATISEDDDIVAMSRELYAEDPAPMPVPERHTRETLATLRQETTRGRAFVLDADGAIAGYVLLITFWSNELGGEVLVIDELFIRPRYRNRGHGRSLLTELTRSNAFGPRPPVAIELEVTPSNTRATALYSSLGFIPVKNTRLRFNRPSRHHSD